MRSDCFPPPNPPRAANVSRSMCNRFDTCNHNNMQWLQATPAHSSSLGRPCPPTGHNTCSHGNIPVIPGPPFVHASNESQKQRSWRNMPKTHPGKAACRAKLSESCSGDQRGRGLAGDRKVRGSGRDAASTENGRAGSGPFPNPTWQSRRRREAWGTDFPPCGSSSDGCQDGLQEQTREQQPGSSKARAPPWRANVGVGAVCRDQGLRVPWGPHTRIHAKRIATPLSTTFGQPTNFGMPAHATHVTAHADDDNTHVTGTSPPMQDSRMFDSMVYKTSRRTRRIPKMSQHPRVPQTVRCQNRFQDLADCRLTPH